MSGRCSCDDSNFRYTDIRTQRNGGQIPSVCYQGNRVIGGISVGPVSQNLRRRGGHGVSGASGGRGTIGRGLQVGGDNHPAPRGNETRETGTREREIRERKNK